MDINKEIKKIASQIKGDEENFEISHFQSGDDLIIPETDDEKWGALSVASGESRQGEMKNREKGEQSEDGEGEEGEGEQEGEDEPIITGDGSGNGDGDGDGEGQEGQGGGGSGKGKGKKKSNEIKVGTKVKIKATGKEGVVTEVRPNGTYKVEEVKEFADGGNVEKIESVPVYAEPVVPEEIEENAEATVPISSEVLEPIEEPIEPVAEFNLLDNKSENDNDDVYTEGELEIIDAGDGDGGEGGEGEGEGEGEGQGEGEGEGQGEQDENDIPLPATGQEFNQKLCDELKERLNRIKQHRFKFPSLGKYMFDADLSDAKLVSTFYKYQVPLVLFNRLAKNVLKRKKPMGVIDAEGYLLFIKKYQPYLKFAVDCLVLSNSNTGYYIDKDKKFETDFSGNKNTINVSRMSFSVDLASAPVSISELEVSLANEDDNTDNFDLYTVNLYVIKLESVIVTDNILYRIVSLSAFSNPEYFGDYWIKPHLDFMFKYYIKSELGFCNIPQAAFQLQRIDDDIIFSLMKENFNLYNIIRTADREDYMVYIFENLKAINSFKKSNLFKINLRDAGEIYPYICDTVRIFYEFSIHLQNNTDNKNLTLFNLQKLSNLQKESYSSYIRDLDLQTLRYGI